MQIAYIGMGANIASAAGEPDATLAAAAERLVSLGRVVGRSSLYSTEPVGLAEQPRFANAVVSLETGLAPRTLLMRLLALEREFGRDRASGILNGPRTLDLDILLMGDLCLHEAGLVIPHPRIADRAFVLVPLNEIAPEAVEPVSRKTVAELLHRLQEKDAGGVHGVVQMESDVWRAGFDADPSGTGRAKDHQSDAHG